MADRFDLSRDVFALRDSFNRLFDEALMRPSTDIYLMLRGSPALDMYETDDQIKVEIPLPGLKPEDVEVTVAGKTLQIKGQREQKEEVKEGNYYRREVHYGAFSRSVTLPEAADVNQPVAAFADGILTVTFPKIPATQPRRLDVKVETAEPQAEPAA